MKSWKLVLALAVLGLVAGGCKGKHQEKPKEISVAARAEAAQNYNEAEFAAQIRDHARAEGLLVKAVELDPEVPNYWLRLGVARKKLGNKDGARKAYEHTRELLHILYERDKSSPNPLLAEMEVCVLLGKPDDAKKIYDQVVHDHGSDPEVKEFVQNRTYDALFQSPRLKEIAL